MLELQSLKGNEQDWNKQEPLAHEVIAFGYEHGVPHDAQLLREFKDVSHPFDGLLSQLPHPPLHELKLQVPEEQSVTAFVRVQADEHVPQFDKV